jgi:putative endonuclease
VRSRLALGNKGEDIAADFLKKNGYRVLCVNYKTKLGEIDIVAEDKKTICFVEVKTRSSDSFGLPQEAVSLRKQRQISKAALIFLKEHRILDRNARFDIISVMFVNDTPNLTLLKNAFELPAEYTY